MSYLGLQSTDVARVANELNVVLADFHIHYQKLKSFHWNIKGKKFFELHSKFEELYDDAKLKIDEVAERILALEKKPLSTASEYLEKSSLKEVKVKLSDDGMVRELLNDYALIIPKLRNIIKSAGAAGDEGTIDLIGGYLEEFEKSGWMLHSYLEHVSVSKTGEREELPQ